MAQSHLLQQAQQVLCMLLTVLPRGAEDVAPRRTGDDARAPQFPSDIQWQSTIYQLTTPPEGFVQPRLSGWSFNARLGD